MGTHRQAAVGASVPPLPKPVPPPTPVLDELSRPFWDGVKEHQLVVQRCDACREWIHPPEPFCPCCLTCDFSYEAIEGSGRIYSFVVMRDRRVRGYEDRVPYINVWVELSVQPGLLIVSTLVDADPDEIEIGQSVVIGYEAVTDDLTLPHFRLAR